MYEFTTLLAQGLKILASVNIILIKSVESLCIVRKIRLRLPVSVEWRNWKQVSAFPALHKVTSALRVTSEILPRPVVSGCVVLLNQNYVTDRGVVFEFLPLRSALKVLQILSFPSDPELIGRVLYDVNLKSGIKWEVPDGEQNVWA